MSNLLNSVGIWPTDPQAQALWIQRLETALTSILADFKRRAGGVVHISQPSEPTQGEWEAAYTSQTGLALPISLGSTLLWTNANGTTAPYVTSPVTGLVVSGYSLKKPGMIDSLQSQTLTTTGTDTHNIGSNLSFYPTVTLTTQFPARFEVSYYQAITSHTQPTVWYGSDVSINGIPIGSSIYGLVSADAPTRINGVGNIQLNVVTPVYPAGIYTFQAMSGLLQLPVTATSTGRGVRQLVVKAILA